MPITAEQYIDLVLGVRDLIKDEIVAPNSPGSVIETRWIAPNGQDDEEWLAYLRDNAGNVDIWLMTIVGLAGLAQESQERGSVGTFAKPLSIALDHHYDYLMGTDESHTEQTFLERALKVDLALEKRKGCLDADGRILIRSWSFEMRLRRFKTASTHWLMGRLQLEFIDLFLI